MPLGQSRQNRRLFFSRLSHFPSSVQRRVRVALDRSSSCDLTLAVEIGKPGLGLPPRLDRSLQLAQAVVELIALAFGLGQLPLEGVTLGRQGGVLSPASAAPRLCKCIQVRHAD